MSEIKDTNPKDSVGVKKAPMHHLPVRVMMELGLSMLEGALKYGSHNYRKAGVRASVYYDALWRHIGAWWEGEDIDPESGVHHIIKAMTCLLVLRDSQHSGNWVDDRPMRIGGGALIQELNKMAAELIDKYPNPEEPYLEIYGGQKNASDTSQ